MCTVKRKSSFSDLDISNAHRDAIYYQASHPMKVWELATKIMGSVRVCQTQGSKAQFKNVCRLCWSIGADRKILGDSRNLREG